MNKPFEKPTEAYQYPKGSHFTWAGDGPFGAANLKVMHSPTIVVSDIRAPLTFEGSLDGSKYGVLRDKDGDMVRITKPGVYRLPVAVVWLRPVCDGAIEISAFVQARA